MEKKFAVLFGLICLISNTCIYSQDGPGGLGKTDGSSDLFLWLDANQIEGVFDRNNVTTWADVSGYGNNASQPGPNNKPNLFTNTLNGFPVVKFNGTTESLSGNLAKILDAPVTLIAVGYFNTDQTASESDYLFSVGSVNTEGKMFGIERNRIEDSDGDFSNDQNKFFSYDGNVKRLGPVINKEEWKIFTQNLNTSAPRHELYIDGSPQVVADYPTSLFDSGTKFSVGIWSDDPGAGETYLDGFVAEIIMFTKVLSETERNIVESYLSAKYDIPIDVSSDKYLGDATPNFDLDVIGIGGSSADVNNRVLKAKSNGLTLEQSTNFTDGDYLMAGHSTKTNTINTTDLNDNNTGGGAGVTLESRWERQWWMDVTDPGNNNTIDITFDMSEAGFGNSLFNNNESDFKLIYRSTNSFGDNWTISSQVPTFSGDRIIFFSVDINAIGGDGYYTIGNVNSTNNSIGTTPAAVGSDGPGGVGSRDGTSNLKLWLDGTEIAGDQADPVITLPDKSGYGNDASADDSGVLPNPIPTLSTGFANGKNSVFFNGNNALMTGVITGGLSAPATIVAVPIFANLNQGAGNDYVISIGASAAQNDHTSISRRNGSGSDENKYYAYDGLAPASASGVHLSGVGETVAGLTWTVITQTQKQGATRHAAFIDGTPFTVSDFNGDLSTNGDYSLGNSVLGGQGFRGGLAEVVAFDKILNAAEMNILHSYLGAKYEISVANDKYDGDNNGASDANYDLDVIGIGSESTDCSLGGAECNLSAAAAGIKIEQNSGFETGDYIVAGHGLATNSINTSDITANSSTLRERLSRIWYFTVTDATPNTATIDITYDVSSAELIRFPSGGPANYKIIYRSVSSDNWDIIAEGISIANDQIFFSSVSMSNGSGYYTIATINNNNSPLPVELVDFKAEILNNKIQLIWQTASEINNDHFEVQRSTDGENFKSILSMAGKGQSNYLTDYSVYDISPLAGNSYYRLKQVDFDGQFEYSEIIRVSYNPEDQLIVFPNPAHKRLHYLGTNKLKSVKAINTTGRVFTQLTFNEKEIDLSTLTVGLYVIIFETDSKIIQKRILINK